jgi:hypothetical protein
MNRFDPKWLQISMSYHHFPNTMEIFAGDLANKLTDRVESMDFKVQDCNCEKPQRYGLMSIWRCL